jgi:hypothetical protein
MGKSGGRATPQPGAGAFLNVFFTIALIFGGRPAAFDALRSTFLKGNG